MNTRSLITHTTTIIAALVLAGAATVAFAWTGPQNTPPACVAGQTGCDAPINVGTGSQVKNGNLSVNVLTATQNSVFYGALGVGSSNAPAQKLDVTGSAHISGVLYLEDINTANGIGQQFYLQNYDGAFYISNSTNYGWTSNRFSIDTSGNVTATGYFHSSDARLKENIETLPGLSIVEKLRGVSFDWKKDGTPSAGVIAQEVEAVMPSAVKTDAMTGLKSVDYDQLIAPLIQAVKEQQAQIDSLQHEVDTLKASH